LALEPSSPAAFDFIAHVAQAYAKLIESPHTDPETGLGGKLFYAGELDDAGRVLVVAANIAGAATLVATDDRAAQKRALRDGVVDFLVTSLDESLRILKNQLRKREPGSVCVALPPAAVEREMDERGVLPDLLRRDVPIAPRHETLVLQEGEQAEFDLRKIPALVTWRVDSTLPEWSLKLDEVALECLDSDAWAARRWLRWAPRFLGRLAGGLRLLDCDREFAARFTEQVWQSVKRGEIGVAVEIRLHHRGLQDVHRFVPDESSGAA
jgi:urocanate hydratase